MKVLVTGDREWTDEAAIERAFDRFQPTELIEGGCRGLDLLARKVAERRGIPVTEVPAQWDRHGKGAGPIRNGEMLNLKPDVVLAFHNNFKNSKGTKNCVDQALKRNVEAWLNTSEHILRLGKLKVR